MMINILAIGRNEQIMQTLVRLINKNEQWRGFGALTDAEAMSIFDNIQPSIIMLTNGIEGEAEQVLRQYFTARNPSVVIIQHYGGGSGLLTNEILEVLAGRFAT